VLARYLVICTVFLVTVGSGTAFGCDHASNSDHCYAYADWDVAHDSGGFLGAKVKISTDTEQLGNSDTSTFMTNELWVDFDEGTYWVESGDIVGYLPLGCSCGGGSSGYGTQEHYFWGNNRPCCGFWAWTWGLVSSYPIDVQIWSAGNPPPNPQQGPTWYVTDDGNSATAYPEDWAWSNRLSAGLESTADKNVNAYELSNMRWESLTQGDWNLGWSKPSSHAGPAIQGPDSGTAGLFCASWSTPYTVFDGAQNLCSGGAGFGPDASSTSTSSASTASIAASPPDDSQLQSDAVHAAAAMGETNPADIARVANVDEQTVASALARDGSMSGASGRSVDVVTEAGHFTGSDLPTPSGSAAPTGTQLTLVIDHATGDIIGVGLTDTAPNLAQLGQTASLG
jgi:hypothetical protein